MKKLIAALFITGILAGCAATPSQEPIKPGVVVQYQYVVSPIPDEDLVIPDQIPAIDFDTATQKTVADWLAQGEGRTLDLETKLKNIKQIQADQVKRSKELNGK